MARIISPLPEPERDSFISTARNAGSGFTSLIRNVASSIFDAIAKPSGDFRQASLPISTPIPTSTPATQYNLDNYTQAITEGYKHWGDLPAARFAQIFAQEAQKYPVLKKYPFLLPAIALLETSGGKNVTYPKNILNWGIRPQAKGLFSPQSEEEVIQKAASGIGQRFSYYENFRKSGNLTELANVYAPIADNPESGGEIYANRLKEVMDIFEQALKKNKR